MLALDQIATKYSAKALRPPIVLDTERLWAMARRPTWLPATLADVDYLELVDDGAALDYSQIPEKNSPSWANVVDGEAIRFENHYNGQLKSYADWAALWRTTWWPLVDARKIYPDFAPPRPPHPFWRRGTTEFDRALAIGQPDEVKMWSRFNIAHFNPEDPRLAYLSTGSQSAVRREILRRAADQFPSGIICLTSALFVHGLVDRCGADIWMWGEELPVECSGIRYFSGGSSKSFSKGHKPHAIEHSDGAVIHVTTPARSIADCFSWHRIVGISIAEEALRKGVQLKLVTPEQVLKISSGREIAGPLVDRALLALSS